MPLTLFPPKAGRSPNWRIRGAYLGVHVDESTGTPNEALARRIFAARKSEIERGRVSGPVETSPPTPQVGPTFLSAAIAYVEAGGEDRFIGRYDETTQRWSGLIAHFGETPLVEITQESINAAAMKLLPHGTPQTRNRQIYTPISAVMKTTGIERKIKRPKGWRGSKRVTWLWPKQAFALFKAADARDMEFGIFLRVLTYTGMRLGECTGMTIDLLKISESFAYVPVTKNGEPRGVHLPPVTVAALANHPRGLDRAGERVFRFQKCGRLYMWLDEALAVAGIDLPPRTGFHVLRHTWATWMRRYGGLDTRGLVGTGAWADEKSAARYEHVVATEEARRADLLPVEGRRQRTCAKDVRLG